MRTFLLLTVIAAFSGNLFSQDAAETRCLYKGIQLTDSRVIKKVDDFTITTTDGITRNLYTALDSGKTIFIDLYFTNCFWCQYYAPIIEQIYENTGAGEEGIEFWGISSDPVDTDPVIDQYKANFNITNPCAGPQGGGVAAHNIVIAGQNFLGWPTYCVICPDRTLYFDPVYPPTVNGFGPYFETCAAMVGMEEINPRPKTGILAVYPNPASTFISLDINMNETMPVKIEMFNLLGTSVYSADFPVTSGQQTLSFSVEQFPEGAYFIRLMQSGKTVNNEKMWIK